MANLLTFLVGGNLGLIAGVYLAQQYDLPRVKQVSQSLYEYLLVESSKYKNDK